jgi:DhnA family fructose-bisphosphate aldolase class Ia
MTGKEIRMGRLFDGTGTVVIVAADHGEFDGPIDGMIDLPGTMERVHPGVDGVLLSPGMVERCAHVFAGKGAPLAVMRINWATTYCFHWGYAEGATVPAIEPRAAAARGADVVLISLTLRTGSERQDARNIEVFCRMAPGAHAIGLPVIGEYFPTKIDRPQSDEFHDEIRTGCRILAELGADMIKTFHTPRFREVVDGCPLPIFGLGAEKTKPQLEALQLAAREIADGARGVVFGRNAIQVPDPVAFQKALCAVVKQGTDPAEAAAKSGLKD